MLLLFRERPTDFGLGLGKLPQHVPVYAFFALLAAPMDRDLFEKVQQDGSYSPRIIRFDDGSVFYVFERIAAAR